MGTIAFDRAADKLKRTSMFLPVFIAALGLLGVSTGLLIQDYFTTVWGYEMLPTAKGFPIIPYLVGLVPPLVQIYSGYLAFAFAFDQDSNTDDKAMWASVIFIIMLIVDVYTDSLFRVSLNPSMPNIWLYAIAESFFIFTLGSELSWALSFGFVVAAGKQGFEMLGRAAEGVILAVATVTGKIISYTIAGVGWLVRLLIMGIKPKTEKPRSQSQRAAQTSAVPLGRSTRRDQEYLNRLEE